MNRSSWLVEIRREAEEQYDIVWSPFYGEKWGLYDNSVHQQFIAKLLALLPEHSHVLDAACGGGRYMPFLLEKGHTVLGIDQSQGMLSRAKLYFPTVHTEKVGLQEISYDQLFDGAICMDAMENVSPEDWPLVLGNFHRALKPQGYLYFTAEVADESDVQKAFIAGQQLGLPVVYGESGEWADENVYHYWPSMPQVREWLAQAGFDVLEEGEEGWYHHFLTREV